MGVNSPHENLSTEGRRGPLEGEVQHAMPNPGSFFYIISKNLECISLWVYFLEIIGTSFSNLKITGDLIVNFRIYKIN